MTKIHNYSAQVTWDGNLGAGTATYSGYGRDYTVTIDGKTDVRGSADPMYRGNASLHNPEDLFVAAVSACHMLTYLALCAKHRITVVAYKDSASGDLELTPDGGGKFQKITLKPAITIRERDKEAQAVSLHEDAHRLCFIAQSSSAPIHHEPSIVIEEAAA